MKKELFSIIITILLFAVIFTGCFEENKKEKTSIKEYDIYVSSDGTADYTSIQDAINIAKDNSSIYVYNGVYNENLLINKTINLYGEDKSNTIIDGKEKSNVVNISADRVIISGFTIQNSGNSSYSFNYRGRDEAGISINSNSNTIENNILTNNYEGISISESSYNVISNNIFAENNYIGLYIGFSDNHTISNNEITENNGWGIYMWEVPNSIVKENIVNANKGGIEITSFSDNSIIKENEIKNNRDSAINLGSNLCIISENVIINNSFGPFTFGVIDVNNGASNNQIHNNSIIKNQDISIYLHSDSSYNHISYNTITNNLASGITISGSSYNKIFKNTLENNSGAGVYIDDYFYPPRWDYGFFVSDAVNNSIYQNNFKNDSAVDELNNTWYNETLMEGNYWSDYTEKYPDATQLNGIWDTPYEISGKNIWFLDISGYWQNSNNIPGGFLNNESSSTEIEYYDNRDLYPLVNPVDI